MKATFIHGGAGLGRILGPSHGHHSIRSYKGSQPQGNEVVSVLNFWQIVSSKDEGNIIFALRRHFDIQADKTVHELCGLFLEGDVQSLREAILHALDLGSAPALPHDDYVGERCDCARLEGDSSISNKEIQMENAEETFAREKRKAKNPVSDEEDETKGINKECGNQLQFQSSFSRKRTNNGLAVLCGKISKVEHHSPPKAKRRRKSSGKLVKMAKQKQLDELRKLHKIFVWGSDIPGACSCFSDMQITPEIRDKLLENLVKLGFHCPTAVQIQTIPVMLENREVLVSAPTGSGKTLAFGLPLLAQVHGRRKDCADQDVCAVILEPTRELAKQTFNELVRLSDGLGIRIHFLPKLKKAGKMGSAQHVSRIDVLVTTPNRLVYELKDEDPRISLKNVAWLIIDESDKLFETGHRGFRKQLGKIYQSCKWSGIRRALFSATFSYDVEDWCKRSLDNPVMVCVGPRNSTVETVDQELTFVGSEQGKLVALRELFHAGLTPPVLIFVQSKDRAVQLRRELKEEGMDRADAIHSFMTQHEREKVIQSFRRGQTWVLVCTDLMGRGLDFKAVNVVINFDFPTSAISYIHRIGRTGRAGRRGRAITFFTESDKRFLRTIATLIKQSGCKVPDFTMELPKASRKTKKLLLRRAPKRERINRKVGQSKLRKKKQ